MQQSICSKRAQKDSVHRKCDPPSYECKAHVYTSSCQMRFHIEFTYDTYWSRSAEFINWTVGSSFLLSAEGMSILGPCDS